MNYQENSKRKLLGMYQTILGSIQKIATTFEELKELLLHYMETDMERRGKGKTPWPTITMEAWEEIHKEVKAQSNLKDLQVYFKQQLEELEKK
jgi:hypothetical protein